MMSNVRLTKLANGTRIITSTSEHAQSVALGIWVGVGGRYETGKMAGVSHFLEHMMFKGTKKRSSKRISEDIEGSGGYLNAFTQEESTCYYARVAYDKLWKALDVLSDMFLNSTFDRVELEKERGVILEEIMMYRDQPHHLVMEMLGSAMWTQHPLGVPIIGEPSTVKNMKRSQMLDFRKTKYIAGNTIFAFAGKVDHDACVERVKGYMDGRGKASVPKYKRVTHETRQRPVVLLEKDIEQSHMALGLRIFGRDDNRRYALRVLNVILGENMSSRLFQVVREKYALAYSVHSSCQLYHDSGVLTVSAGLDRSKTKQGIDLILKEMSKLKAKAVGAQELKRAKEYLVGQMRLSLESTSSQMICLGESLISYGKFTPREEIIANVESVTAADIQRLAKSIMRRQRATIALIVPSLDRGDERFYRKQLNTL